MSYAIEIRRSAQKSLGKINRQDQDRIITAIESLSDNARPDGCEKLSGRPAWRIRIGSYRVIYEILDDKLIVMVVHIGHRREVYK